MFPLAETDTDTYLGHVNKQFHTAVQLAMECRNNSEICNLTTTMLNVKNLQEVWASNLTHEHSKMIFAGDSFWHKLAHAWHDYNYHEPQNRNTVLCQSIYWNSHVLIENRPVEKGYIGNKVKKIGDIYDVH